MGNAMTKDTPAIAAHKKSIAFAMARDKESWLALFDPDAIVHDPVGKSPHDPEGQGFHGLERIGQFWDIMIAPLDMIAIPHKRIASGPNTVAVIMSAANNLNGLKAYVEMVAVYTVNEAGKLISLSVYWDVDALAAQMGAAG
jgi:ketosteroid isomerase-like protein